MKGEKPNMEREEYRPSRFRVNLNLYGGAVLGAIAPIVATRYTICREEPSVFAWFDAAMLNILTLASPICSVAGLASGYFGLRQLTQEKNTEIVERRERESALGEL